jgi:hypothetical protein
MSIEKAQAAEQRSKKKEKKWTFLMSFEIISKCIDR